jgi:hypothetical protein
VRRKDPDKLLRNVKAEEVGFEYGIYDVQDPTPDLPADFADESGRSMRAGCPGPSARSIAVSSVPLNGRSSCCMSKPPGHATPTSRETWQSRAPDE